LAAEIREAIGAGPDEEVHITTPQFERDPGQPEPAAAPTDWEALRTMTRIELKELGCGTWNDPKEPDDEFDGKVLMLFPGEWYQSIPAGYVVTDIFNEDEEFVRGQTDDDIRFGCLSYGILVDP
jgi:hypothetical protein